MRFFLSVALVMQMSLTCNCFTSNLLRFRQHARGGKSLAKTQVRGLSNVDDSSVSFEPWIVHVKTIVSIYVSILVRLRLRQAVRMSETATKAQKGESGVGNLNRWDPSAQQVCLLIFSRLAQLSHFSVDFSPPSFGSEVLFSSRSRRGGAVEQD